MIVITPTSKRAASGGMDKRPEAYNTTNHRDSLRGTYETKNGLVTERVRSLSQNGLQIWITVDEFSLAAP